MYDIFNVEFKVYNRPHATALVKKIKTLKKVNENRKAKNEEQLESIQKKLRRKQNLKIRVVKRKQPLNNKVKIAKIKDTFSKLKNSQVRKLNGQNNRKIRMTEDKITNAKLELFNLMAKIVVKNINNYMNLAFNSPVTEQCFERDEMQAEAWLILENCVDKFKVDKGYCFYFYYNKAMGRNFYRMFFNTVQTKDKKHKYSTETKHTASRSTNAGNHSMELLIGQLDLDERELRILRSKLKNEKKSDFLANNKDFSAGRYYSTLKKVKEIILKLQEDGEL